MQFLAKLIELVGQYPGQFAFVVSLGIVVSGGAWTAATAAARKRWPNVGDAMASFGPYVPWMVKAGARALENRARAKRGLEPLPYEPLPLPDAAVASMRAARVDTEAKRLEQLLLQQQKPDDPT